MRITNRDVLHPRRSTGPRPVPVAPVADALAPAQADAAGPSAPRRRRRSGQRSRQARTERRRATCVASQRDAIADEAATTLMGGVQFPGRGFPSACAAQQWRTPRPTAPMWRRARAVSAATTQRLGTSPPPPTTRRTAAQPASCRPLLRMGTRSGTSSACRTQ
jgi:hypothetical protein